MMEFAKLLHSYGGWGLSAVLLSAVLLMYKQIMAEHEKRATQQEQQHEKLFNLMEKKIEVDVKHEQAFKSLREIIQQLIGKF